MSKRKKLILLVVMFSALITVMTSSVSATSPGITFSVEGLDTPANTADTVKIILVLTVIALVPSILVLMTGFTRISIILSFVRNALGLQQTPPNQVLIGLALFLTVFLMMPTFKQIYNEAYVPYVNDEITQDDALDKAITPLKVFMLEQTDESDLALFMEIADAPPVESMEMEDLLTIGTEIVIPAFILSELKWAFMMGIYIYIPFLIIDLVVSSTLMSLGMMMLPPAMVSMPFKLILFLLVDGWNLIIQIIFVSFQVK